jgi:hypothetical protein
MGTVCNSYKIRGRKLKAEGRAGVTFDRNHHMKKHIALLAALAALTLPAPAVFTLGSDGPGGFSVWHEDHWDHNGIHVDPPQSVPEASPTLVVALAGAALIMRRNGGAR